MSQLMGKEGRNHDPKKIYYSEVADENELHVIVGKVSVIRIASKVGRTMMTLTHPTTYVGTLL